MKNKKGFSIIEIIVVLMILAILAALAWPTLVTYYSDSSEEIYLAEGEKILTAAQVEAKKYISKHNSLSEFTLNDLKESILKRTALSGEIISIYANDDHKDVGFFSYKVEDGSCYVIYENQKLYISKTSIEYMDSLSARVRNGVFSIYDTIFKEYFSTRTNANMDSTGPNFGIKYASILKDMGIDVDSCYFRIYHNSATKNYTLTISNVPLTTDMEGRTVNVVQYKFIEGFEVAKVDQYEGTAVVKVREEKKGTNGPMVEYAYLDGDGMKLTLVKKGIEFSTNG